jgi:hypothetical protein
LLRGRLRPKVCLATILPEGFTDNEGTELGRVNGESKQRQMGGCSSFEALAESIERPSGQDAAAGRAGPRATHQDFEHDAATVVVEPEGALAARLDVGTRNPKNSHLRP